MKKRHTVTAAALMAHTLRTGAAWADARRRRFNTRLALIPARCTLVVVGGRGANRRLAGMLANLIGAHTISAGATLETADLIMACTGRLPVVILAPHADAKPLRVELRRRDIQCVHVLAGLKSRDRESFLRHAIRARRPPCPR